MKACLCFILALICIASTEMEECLDVANCSDSLKNRCSEMSESLKKLTNDKKLALACKNGVCMCNIEFVENVVPTNPSPTEMNAEKDRDDDDGGKEVEEKDAPKN